MFVENIDFLISNNELFSLINSTQEVVILDVRDKESFLQAHLPHAVHAPEIFTYLPEEI